MFFCPGACQSLPFRSLQKSKPQASDRPGLPFSRRLAASLGDPYTSGSPCANGSPISIWVPRGSSGTGSRCRSCSRERWTPVSLRACRSSMSPGAFGFGEISREGWGPQPPSRWDPRETIGGSPGYHPQSPIHTCHRCSCWLHIFKLFNLDDALSFSSYWLHLHYLALLYLAR